MKGWWTLLVSGILVLSVLVACAPAATPTPPTAAPAKPTAAPAQPTAVPTTATKPTAAPAQATASPAPAKSAAAAGPSQALVDAAKAEGKLVLYSFTGREGLDQLIKAFTNKYGIKVDFTRKGGPEIVALVDAELRTGKLKADLMGVGEEAQAAIWSEQGLFMKYQPEAAKALPAEVRDAGGYYVPQYWTLSAIMYSTQRVKKEELPKTYKELTDPKWRGKLATVRSRGSGIGSSMVNSLVNTYSWSYFEELAKNDPFLASGGISALPALVANGEADLCFPMNEHSAIPLMAKGEPLALLYPTDVIPAGTAVWAINKDAVNVNAAKLFMDFIVSDEFQTSMVKEVGARSVSPNAPPPAGAPPLKDLKLVRSDTAWLNKHLAEQDDKFDSVFLGAKTK